MPLPAGIMSPSSGVRSNHLNQHNNVIIGDHSHPRMATTTTTTGSARSNTRRRFWCRIMMWLGLLLSTYQILWSYWLAGLNIPDIETDKVTGQQRIRRRPDKLVKRDHVQGKDVPTTPFDGIMEGYLTLLNIKVPATGLKSDATANKLYTGVQATFCHLSWQMQDQNPNAVPTFQHLRDASPLCAGTRVTVDLWEITRQAESYDWRNHSFAATVPQPGQGPHPPTAVIFHQTRCGSTLVANVLASFMADHTRVYSEAPAPMAALLACDDSSSATPGAVTCDPGAHVALIRDVFYLMGRSPGPTLPQYVFYKIQSSGAHFLPVFTQAMPDTSWMFVYRDPTEILMSHFKNVLKGPAGGGNPLGANFLPNCLRNFGTNQHPALLEKMVEARGRTMESLTKEEYCAAHLASLGEAAVTQYHLSSASSKNNGKEPTHRWLVNYAELPHKIWETILPDVVPFVSKEQRQHMQAVAQLEAKGIGEKAGHQFHEDATVKQGKATADIKAASDLFMRPVYEKLEDLRLQSGGK